MRPQELSDFRVNRLKSKLSRADIHGNVQPHARDELKGKRILLLHELLQNMNFPDRSLTDDMQHGFRITGWLQDTHTRPTKVLVPSLTSEDLWSARRDNNRRMWGMCRPSGDDALDKALWQQTVKECESGWATWHLGLTQPPENSVLSRRFAVQQQDKVRPIDDFSVSQVNHTLGCVEKIMVMPSSATVSLALALQRGLTAQNDVSQSSGAVALSGKTFDLKSAYKQLPIHSQDLKFAQATVWNPEAKRPTVVLLKALHYVLVPITVFFDDYTSVVSDLDSSSSEAAFVLLMRILGWKVAADKGQPYACLFQSLGISFLLPRSATDPVQVSNTEHRRKELAAVCLRLLRSGRASPHECSVFAGRLRWMEGQTFDRLGRKFFRAILASGDPPSDSKPRVMDPSLRQAFEWIHHNGAWQEFSAEATVDRGSSGEPKRGIIAAQAYPRSNMLIVQACLAAEVDYGLSLWIARDCWYAQDGILHNRKVEAPLWDLGIGSRHSDMRRAIRIDIDAGSDFISGFVELTVQEPKQSRAARRKRLMLPVVAPLMGIGDRPWGSAWQAARKHWKLGHTGNIDLAADGKFIRSWQCIFYQQCEYALVQNPSSGMHHVLKQGRDRLTVLSPQQLVSCAENPDHCGGTGGCDGSTSELAMDYIIDHGLTYEEVIPYGSFFGAPVACDTAMQYHAMSYKMVSITGWVKTTTNSLSDVMHAIVNYGPLAISVDASHWSPYSSGIANPCDIDGNVDIDHAVGLVGYGVDGGKKYWTVRNSWGATWGENGYIRLERQDDESYCGTDHTPHHGSACEAEPDTPVTVCGTCGILYDVSYPTGAEVMGVGSGDVDR
ncbi:CEP1 [Symbiodinium pilosum]|uniref:CEP1 protein n=1 Tax=Symbiodinium pilosum TaxID=2952 RepID=A0A812JQW5_SYMPI|nr:CEP1 [Symbiodinium pilosum]